ncbi:hypothetical protein AU476_13680 [Cupriavidus sp. UYMSc13B]|nr:hypothetical protein AU476_13680 [Cupriavidus sp. UYMSc13B]
MRTLWQTYITGGTIDLNDPDVQAKVTAIGNTAQNDRNNLIPAGSRTNCLWSDLCTWSQSANLTNNFKRIQEMVLGYGTQGSSVYHDEAMLTNILDALQWLYSNQYNPTVAQFDNWWDWEIGIPKLLGNILITLYDQVPAYLMNNYIAAMDHFNADSTNQTWPVANPPVVMTGANLLDKVMGRVFSGMLADDTNKIVAARQAMQPVYANVTSDDGFYEDGSFIQHHYVSYMGGYGGPLIDDITNLMYLTNGTQWSFSGAEIQTVVGWVNNSITPLVYLGGMMDMSRGRKISRSSETDHVAGRAMAVSVRRLADAVDSTTAAQINGTVKGWIQGDAAFNHASGCSSGCYFTGMSLYDLTRMKALAADASVSTTQWMASRMFGSMARAVHITPTFGFGLSMLSDRISSFEYGNSENKKGWLTGAGMTAIYTDDQKQFSNNFWATIDYGRLPGTTVDGADFGTPLQWSFYGNASGGLRWTGGSTVLGAYTSAGMEFDMSGFLSREQPQTRSSPSHLSGKKSWFMMDDRIVALGSDIADDVSRPVETIVDNRRLIAPYTGSAGGNNKLTINNSGYNGAALGSGPQTVTAVRWAHLQGSSQSTCSPALNNPCNNGSKGVGYIFPNPVTLTVLREARTDAWSNVGTGSTNSVTDNYLSLAVSHGTNPTAANYAYVLLPNKSAAEVNTIASNSGISILSNGNGIHSVMYNPASGGVTRVVGANFWSTTGGTVNIGGQGYLTSSTKASVTVAETASNLSLAVSDPTEAGTGTVTIEINRSAGSVGAKDSAVTVVQLNPTIKLAIDVSVAHGRSIAANFNF